MNCRLGLYICLHVQAFDQLPYYHIGPAYYMTYNRQQVKVLILSLQGK